MSGCCITFRKWTTLLLYLVGLGLSCYAYYVKLEYQKDPENYRALCDVDEAHSCTTVLATSYSKGFGILGTLMGDDAHPLNQPNALYGVAFYALNFLLYALCGANSKLVAEFQFYSSILASFVSCYLAYLLYAVIKNVCYLCVATYAVNYLLLVNHFFHRRHLRNKIVPEYSRQYSSASARSQPTLPTQFDFKKNI